MIKRTILCIDDDPTFTDLYQAIFSQSGYAVHVANNAKIGQALAVKEHPSLILLDVMMPESGGFRDGFDLLERLRKEGGPCQKTPIIMISAIGGGDDEKHGLALGANAYIPKQELSPDRLIATAEKFLA